MERKIGEIFEYNGEWYQCLPEILICVGCAFKNKTCKKIRGIRGECERASRQTDGVIFKKLKKVGEPYVDCGTILQRFKIYTNVTDADTKGLELHIYSNNTIGIEIKQTKEDMEEYKMHDTKEDIPEFDKVVDECLFGKDKLNLKPFDIQKAKEGKPVCTRDGRKARIICFDAKGNKPLIILSEIDGKEVILRYTEKGQSDNFHSPTPREDDLMMVPEKKEGWVNVYKTSINYECGKVFSTEQEAKNKTNDNRIATVRIEWEE